MSRADWTRPALVALSVLALGVTIAADLSSPLRPLVAVWFLLVCPGMALAPLLRLGDGWNELAVALPLSVALDTIVAGGFLYAGAWSPTLILVVLAALSLAGAALQVRGPRLFQ